jgi:hypothetical protein
MTSTSVEVTTRFGSARSVAPDSDADDGTLAADAPVGSECRSARLDQRVRARS